MAVVPTGGLLSSVRSTFRLLTGSNVHPALCLQTREYAARKSTREKALKKKAARVREKLAEKARNEQRQKLKMVKQKVIRPVISIPFDEYSKPAPVRNVWLGRYHSWKVYSFEEAIECHRQTHHPTMYNIPNADVEVFIELKQNGKKKSGEGLSKVFYIPNKFTENVDKSIVAFTKNTEILPSYVTANIICGGRDLIKQFESGTYKVNNYDYIISDRDILNELLIIRGLLKKQFPSVKSGTLGNDIQYLIEKFKYGANCLTQSYSDGENHFLLSKICIGRLNMEVNHLEENFSSILEQIQSQVLPKYMISRVRMLSPPSTEKFKIDISKYHTKPEVEEDTEAEDLKDAIIDAV